MRSVGWTCVVSWNEKMGITMVVVEWYVANTIYPISTICAGCLHIETFQIMRSVGSTCVASWKEKMEITMVVVELYVTYNLPN